MKTSLSILLALMISATSSTAHSQSTGSISGFVYDAANGEALIGANVFLQESYLGSSTNISGYYVIPKIYPGSYTLVCSYLGYKTHKQAITIETDRNRKIDIVLTAESLQLEEVVVTAESLRTSEKLYNKSISSLELSPRQINQIPQIAEADLLRTLQNLPGILPISDFSSALYVRGGTPDQNLYMIDGTDVYNPEHAFGIFSTFNTEAIKQVDLSKGGFGAEYGGRLSSVLNVTNLDGNREYFEGTAAISLLSAKTTLQMPLGRTGSISGSLRRTYFDKTIAKAIDDVPDYYFYDGNLKAFFELDENNKLTISGYGGRDFLNVVFNNDASEDVGFDYEWGNRTASVRWTRVFNPRLFGNFWITGSRFSSDIKFEEIGIDERNFVSDLTFKANLEYHLSNHLQTKFGFEQKNLHVLFRQNFPGGAVNVDSRPEHYVGYVVGIWRPNPLWNIEGGLRYNYFSSDKSFQDIAPRFSAKYRLNETTNLKAAAGIYHQYLHRIPRFVVSDIWSVSNNFQDQSTSKHLIFGFQKEIAGDLQFEVESFYKDYQNIYSFNQTFLTELTAGTFNENNEPIYTETDGIFNRGDGHSYGFEFLLRRDIGIVSGWLGYSLARTEYTIDQINDDDPFVPRHDRTHTVNLVSNIDLKNALRRIKGDDTKRDRSKWLIGVNFVYSTGQPFTEPGSGYITGSSPASPRRYVEYAPTRINNIRFPHYARLDLSVTWRKQYRGWSLAPYLQIYNLGNRKNVWFVNYEFNSGLPEVDEQHMFPLLPTIGVNLKF